MPLKTVEGCVSSSHVGTHVDAQNYSIEKLKENQLRGNVHILVVMTIQFIRLFNEKNLRSLTRLYLEG